MSAAILALALLLIVAAVALAARARLSRPRAGGTAAPDGERRLAGTRQEAAAIVDEARAEALATREAVHEEVEVLRASLEAREAALNERERTLRERREIFDERRFAYRKRREEIEARGETIDEQRAEISRTVAERAALDPEQAASAVLDRLDAELATEHPVRVEGAVTDRVGELAASARYHLVLAMEREHGSHADLVPKMAPLPLENLDESAREQLLQTLQVLAENTSTELGVDQERNQATLRGLDPVGREIARQASLEVLDRRLQAADVPPLLVRTRRSLTRAITEIGDRALWEMRMEGRPELAELMGTLNYRFSYGQNALLHCRETGHLCGLLATELGLPQAMAREAGMLHDIGKAVDHDVEGSHAIIGGELLRLFGTDAGIVHAVKAHHFDEEPSTDLAMLTICADALSASRPGARRDTLTAYLARLEQLQEIATRHRQVERAFPLQAGREVRVFVKAKNVEDDDLPTLSTEIAHDIESEMQYPGVIKVTVIRETAATATAPAQIGRGTAVEEAPPELAAASPRRRKRKRRRSGAGRADGDGGAENGENGSSPAG